MMRLFLRSRIDGGTVTEAAQAAVASPDRTLIRRRARAHPFARSQPKRLHRWLRWNHGERDGEGHPPSAFSIRSFHAAGPATLNSTVLSS